MFTEERVLTINWDCLDFYLENIIGKFHPELDEYISGIETEREDYYYVSLMIRFNSNSEKVQNFVIDFLKSLELSDDEIEEQIETLEELNEINIPDTSFVKIIEKDKNIEINSVVAAEHEVIFFTKK